MGCKDAAVRIYDWQTGQSLRTLSLPLKNDQEIWAITADGRYALTRTWKEYTMRLWSLEGTISGTFSVSLFFQCAPVWAELLRGLARCQIRPRRRSGWHDSFV